MHKWAIQQTKGMVSNGWLTRDCVWTRQRGIISPFAQDVRSNPVIASSSQTITEEGAPTADTYLDTDEEWQIFKVHPSVAAGLRTEPQTDEKKKSPS